MTSADYGAKINDNVIEPLLAAELLMLQLVIVAPAAAMNIGWFMSMPLCSRVPFGFIFTGFHVVSKIEPYSVRVLTFMSRLLISALQFSYLLWIMSIMSRAVSM